LSYFRSTAAGFAANDRPVREGHRPPAHPDVLPNPRHPGQVQTGRVQTGRVQTGPGQPTDLWSGALSRPPAGQQAGQPAPGAGAGSARTLPLTRRYEISYLGADGQITEATRLAPAIASFEEAFSAVARGTVIATAEGSVAVEDLLPGMRVLTAEGREEPVDWIGAMTIYPAAALPGIAATTLTRITAEAFGLGRPAADLVLGPRARLLLRDARVRAVTGGVSAYAPARSFIDGVSIIEVVPAAPVTVYNLVLRQHGSLRAAGLEIESFHPRNTIAALGDPHLAGLFLGLFPHLRGYADFGAPAHPRMSDEEVETALLG